VAQQALAWLGATANSRLLVGESGCAKKGNHSTGVARQWNGRQGKADNCQVSAFGALGKVDPATLRDVRLYLPKAWVDNRTIPRAAVGRVSPSRSDPRARKNTFAYRSLGDSLRELAKERRAQTVGGSGRRPRHGTDRAGRRPAR